MSNWYGKGIFTLYPSTLYARTPDRVPVAPGARGNFEKTQQLFDEANRIFTDISSAGALTPEHIKKIKDIRQQDLNIFNQLGDILDKNDSPRPPSRPGF